jgi:hypothetical protein
MSHDRGAVNRRTSRHAFVTVVCALLFLVFAPTSFGSMPTDWPPFLRADDDYPAPIANAIKRLWTDATFTRTVKGDPAAVPLSFYLRFIDAPDVTAAAARHLGLTTYHVRILGDDSYEADDGHGGARGVYRVLERGDGRRMLLSWGSHRGSILGTVSGSALTQLEFGDDGGRATQRLTVNVIIDQGIAATLTRPVLFLFGGFVDRKLNEAFRTAAGVAGWAEARPEEFCAWLDGAVTRERRAELREVFEECVAPSR